MSRELIRNLITEIKTNKNDLKRHENELRYFRYLLSNTNPVHKENLIQVIAFLKELIYTYLKNIKDLELMLENVIC